MSVEPFTCAPTRKTSSPHWMSSSRVKAGPVVLDARPVQAHLVSATETPEALQVGLGRRPGEVQVALEVDVVARVRAVEAQVGLGGGAETSNFKPEPLGDVGVGLLGGDLPGGQGDARARVPRSAARIMCQLLMEWDWDRMPRLPQFGRLVATSA